MVGPLTMPPTVEPGVKGFLQMQDHIIRSMQPAPPRGFNYHSPIDFVLDRGRAYRSEALTPAERKVVKAAAGRHKYRKKECFYNAHMLVMRDMTRTLVYTEGWAFNGLMPVYHGWVTINGKVVDLTWDDKGSPIMGALPEGWEYYGVEFPDRVALAERVARTELVAAVIDAHHEGWPVLQWERMTPPTTTAAVL